MKDKIKPKYNAAQNVGWMVKIAWKVRKRVLFICVAMAALEVLYNLTQLYVAPEILSCVERHAPVGELLGTIGFFTLALFLTMGLKEYLREISMYPRVDVRSSIVGMIARKCNMTSFPNTLDVKFIKLKEKAHHSVQGNTEAAENIWKTLTVLLQNVGGFLVYLAILSRLNWMLLVVIAATCVVGFLVSRYSSNWIFRHRDAEETFYAKKSYIRKKAESVELAKDIRIFGLQNWLNELLDRIHNVYLDFRLRCEKIKLLADVTEALLTMARNGIAYAYLLHLALRDSLSVPEFILYFTAVSTFTTWVMGILQAAEKLHEESLDLSQVREFLEYPETFRFEGGTAIPKADAYELELEHVSFRYPGAEEDTIHDLDLTVRPGEKLAIVGLNGAGKTTLVKLLCGLFDPTEGRVLLNGVDVRDFNRREYYGLFSAVFQEFSILDVTVAENIAQTNENIDTKKLWDCIEKAGLTETIQKLPKGLDTHVGRQVYLDGVLFSGGQTQRLMLARALYKDGAILLLDEPTAALDPLAENDIYQKYKDMTAGKTSLFISHRLASTRFCDRIIFVADGHITEEGTHDQLLARGGAYASSLKSRAAIIRKGRRSDYEKENEFQARSVRSFPCGKGAARSQPQIFPGGDAVYRRGRNSALCDGVLLRPDSEGAGAAPQARCASELGHRRGAVYRTVRRREGGAVSADGDHAGRSVRQKRDAVLPEVLLNGLCGRGQAGDPRPAGADRPERELVKLWPDAGSGDL